ncbi:hypothetical protein [Mangrovibacterium marinum]|uniref:Uncharacterized protein n=1 Tax=Mangrovibacterium marinum TaxID=1639118 RepID=A0A2T5BYF6_9BACT|nr:hypothetical protein [Mangrovibacterium marinum]PTN07242.1 hypothetical protein C8N47_12027 [Mangrovibacterium marinum]
MNIFFKIFPFILIPIFTLSCTKSSDEPDDPEDDTNNVEVYYSTDGVSKKLLMDKDTIAVNLADTFLLYVDISDTSKVLDYSLDYSIDNSETGIDPFNFEEKEDYRYIFSTNKSGVFGIGVFVNFRRDDFDYYLAGFNIKVPTIDYTIISLETPTYTITTDNDILNNEIENELATKYTISFRPLTLASNTLTGGTYQLKNASEEISSGSFTSTDTEGLTDLSFNYNDITFNYNLVEEEDGNGKYFLFTQDLTEVYQAEYPNHTIDKVTLTFRGFRNQD